VVDTLGDDILTTILSQINYGGIISTFGLALSHLLEITVLPFILRGVLLIGIDSVMCSYNKRVEAWERLSNLVNRFYKMNSYQSFVD